MAKESGIYGKMLLEMEREVIEKENYYIHVYHTNAGECFGGKC